MRLIDADKLRPYEFERNYIHIDELDNAPTVDAIPMSVIEDIKQAFVDYTNTIQYKDKHLIEIKDVIAIIDKHIGKESE